ncbi:MAG TPA: hypothetical protein VGG62_02310 [Terracidiphilus sp.]
MARKSGTLSFEQILDALRAHSFEIKPFPGVADGVMVSKGGAAAVLVPGKGNQHVENGATGMAVTPGILVRGEIARLLDRGYQKFIKTSQYELPATAAQLQTIHQFTEELNQVTGAMGLYNESLGTTSELYQYDRLRGREVSQAAPARPWELSDGH